MYWGLGAVAELDAVDYLWSTLATDQSIVVNPLVDETFTVEMTYLGITCTGSTEVQVSEPPNLTVSVDSASCNAANGVILVSTSGGSQPFNFDWAIANPGSLFSGIYDLILTDSYNCLVLDSSITVPTYLGPTGPILGETCVSGIVQHDYSVPQNECMAFAWTMSNGIIVTGQGTESVVVSWTDTTTGWIQVQVTNSEGYDQTFILNLDDCTGISEVPALQVELGPNPTDGMLHINSTEYLERMEILNSAGQILRHWEGLNEKAVQLDLSDLPVGSYLLMLKAEKGKAFRLISKY